MAGRQLGSWLLLAGLALAGMALFIYATASGLAIYPDSIDYITAARNLLSGIGLSVLDSQGGLEPMTHFPPLLSSVLAGLGCLGLEPQAGARWLGVACGGVITASVGLMALRITGSLWSTAVVGILAVFSPQLVAVCSCVGTEPLFLALSAVGVLVLAQYLRSGSWRLLLVSGILFSLAFLDRYVGGALVLAAGLCILFAGPHRWERRLWDYAVFGFICGVPMLLWILRNKLAAGTATDRQTVYHPLGTGELVSMMRTVEGWVLPEQVWGYRRGKVLLVLALVCAWLVGAAIVWAWKRGALAPKPAKDSETERPAAWPLLIVLAALSVTYLAALTVSMFFFDAATAPDARMLLPVQMWGIVLGVAGAWWFFRWTGRNPAAAALIVGLCVVMLCNYLPRTTDYMVRSHRGEVGFYTTKEWTHSPTLLRLASLPKGTPIYSNAPEAVYFLVQRPAAEIPAYQNYYTHLLNNRFATEMAAMRNRMEEGRGVMVVFDKVNWRTDLLAHPQLATFASLSVLDKLPDGVVYYVPRPTTQP